jgi:hypothetical protein
MSEQERISTTDWLLALIVSLFGIAVVLNFVGLIALIVKALS